MPFSNPSSSAPETQHDYIRTLESRLAARDKIISGLLEEMEIHRILLDESTDPIFMFQAGGKYLYVNRAFATGVGKPVEAIAGHNIHDVFTPDEAEKRLKALDWVFRNAKTLEIEVRVPTTTGDTFYITTIKPILNESQNVSSVICISKNITERKRMEQDLLQLSTHDALTGLYNRGYFQTELNRLQSGRHFPVGILVADMNNLKLVNDRHGHSVGDEVLRLIAHTMQHTFRAEDIVARIGGDEFAILLPQTGEAAAREAIARLRSNLAETENELASISIGLAIGEEHSDLAMVLREADHDMYREKLERRQAT